MKKRTYICYLENKSTRQLYIEQIYSGIRRAAAARRETVVPVSTTAEALKLCAETGEKCVIVAHPSLPECYRVLHTLHAQGVHVIMANMGIDCPGILYSLVEADYEGGAYRLTAGLLTAERRNPVFLGLYPGSYHDALRYSGTVRACKERGIKCDVIENRGDIAAAADSFLARRDEFDIVVCANDFIARYLLRADPDIAEIPMASLGGRMRFKEENVATAIIDYEQVGARIVDAYLLLMRCDFSLSVTIRIPPHIEGASVSGRSAGERAAETDFFFYQDLNVELVERVQRIQNSADDIDAAILDRLQRGMTYESIAEDLYLSVRTVKNHAKKLFDAAGCKTKKEFTDLIRRGL